MLEHIRNLCLAVATLTGVCAAPAGANAAASGLEAAEHKVAVVRIVVTERDGVVVRGPSTAVPWGTAAAIRIQSARHDHTVKLDVDRNGSRVLLGVDYARDGKTVTTGKGVETKAHRRATVVTDDGTTLTLTVIPTTVAIQTH